MVAQVLLILLLVVAAVRGDGIIIPELPFEPLAIKYHRVTVEIDDQAAHTDIDQVFVNPQPRDVEGTYIFPLPTGASFSAFSMHVDGEQLHAEILSADEARRIYEEIVRQRIDPAFRFGKAGETRNAAHIIGGHGHGKSLREKSVPAD